MTIKRKYVLGLSALSVVAFFAFMAQSALAFVPVAAETTAYTCVENGGEKDYSDAHCDNAVTKGTGKFGHVAIAENTETELAITNAATKNSTTEAAPAVLEGELGGAKLKLTATTVTGTGKIKNSGGHVTGNVHVEYTGITVNEPANCTKNKVEFNANFEGVHNTGSAEKEKEMGLLFKPKEGEVFVTIVLEGAKCALAGKELKVKGTAIATSGKGATANGSGATSVFEPGTMEPLEIGGNAAKFSSTTTTKMAGTGGNPIALTTGK